MDLRIVDENMNDANVVPYQMLLKLKYLSVRTAALM
jgi:hypothetical protein